MEKIDLEIIEDLLEKLLEETRTRLQRIEVAVIAICIMLGIIIIKL